MIFGSLMLIILWVGYRLLAPRLEHTVNIDIYSQPSELSALNPDNLRFLSYRQAQIAQIGILTSIQAFFGAILGVFYGPLQMLWVVSATLFLGGIVNYYAGIYAIKNNGKTWLFHLREKYHRQYIFCATLALITVIIGFAATCLLTYYISYCAYNLTSISYIYFIIMLMVALLNQSNFNHFAMSIGSTFIAISIYFLILSIPELSNANLVFDWSTYPRLKTIYPMMFFIVCGGVLSGIEALKCSLLAPAIKNEKMAKGIYFSSSVYLAGFIILWDLILLAWNPNVADLASSINKFKYPYELIDALLLRHFNFFNAGLFYILLISLCICSGATLLRVAKKIVIEEGTLEKIPSYSITIALFLIMMLIYTFSIGTSYFEILNMLLVCLWLYFAAEKIPSPQTYKITIFLLLGLCFAQILLAELHLPYKISALSGLSFSLAALLIYFVHRQIRKK